VQRGVRLSRLGLCTDAAGHKRSPPFSDIRCRELAATKLPLAQSLRPLRSHAKEAPQGESTYSGNPAFASPA
jgi:hypothetical protein